MTLNLPPLDLDDWIEVRELHGEFAWRRWDAAVRELDGEAPFGWAETVKDEL